MNKKKSWFSKFFYYFVKTPANEEQLLELLHQAQVANTLSIDSLRMIEGVIQISHMCVSEIMLPRSEMVIIQKDAPFKTILQIAIKSGHSRFPVIGESKDEVIGILLAKDLLSHALENLENKSERFDLKNILRVPVYVPENKPLGVLLNEFRNNRNHIAIVVNEYAHVTGLVSIEDVLEQIVGDIEDEHDIDNDIYIRQHKDSTYSIKAFTPIAEFNQYFNTQLKDDEYDTIGGLVLAGFGHLPKRGETITIESIPFKVLRANKRRIQLLQTTLKPGRSHS